MFHVSCIIQLQILPLKDGHYYHQIPTFAGLLLCLDEQQTAWWAKQHFSQEPRMMTIVMDSQ
jgi:hypothetical protein